MNQIEMIQMKNVHEQLSRNNGHVPHCMPRCTLTVQ